MQQYSTSYWFAVWVIVTLASFCESCEKLEEMFDYVVLLDDRMVAEGKDAGREDGRARGFKEGEGMGRGKGFQTAAEMGFCRGCCLAWLSMHAQDPGRE